MVDDEQSRFGHSKRLQHQQQHAGMILVITDHLAQRFGRQRPVVRSAVARHLNGYDTETRDLPYGAALMARCRGCAYDTRTSSMPCCQEFAGLDRLREIRRSDARAGPQRDKPRHLAKSAVPYSLRNS
jgi:hypothetical protein